MKEAILKAFLTMFISIIVYTLILVFIHDEHGKYIFGGFIIGLILSPFPVIISNRFYKNKEKE